MKLIKPFDVGRPAPHVTYVWNLPTNDDCVSEVELVEAARPVAHCLHTLGWGVDMSFADALVVEDGLRTDAVEHWIPTRRFGEPLKIPIPGFIDDLDRTYRRFASRTTGTGVDTDTRPLAYRLQNYSVAGEIRTPYSLFALDGFEGEPFSVPWEDSMVVAAWLRHAVGKVLRKDPRYAGIVDSYVLGHVEETDDLSARLSFIPLPSTTAAHGDARIRRAMVVEPKGASGELVLALRRTLVGAELEREQGGAVCTVNSMEPDGVTRMYTQRGRVWRSTTPVVLHGYNSQHGRVSVKKTERLLLRAFEMAGVGNDRIESLAFQPAPFWRGCGAAFRIRAPQHLAGWPRYHVQVTFRDPVRGPVLAGIGRHSGLGVFARVE